jgi:DNA (cytosine-5)-methyltransferase 1
VTAYYNEIDPFAAQWLRNLIAAGHIAPGDVDERSIEDVQPNDLAGYDQCHFFAGIGVWSHALRLAGWPDGRPVWTGSCPCQPFSAAGKRGGFDDARHLWPAWQRLIAQRSPRVVFGEQVASKDGYAWLDAVQSDVEGLGYACGPVVLPAAGFGAPHGRHRIYFVADTEHPEWRPERPLDGDSYRRDGLGRRSDAGSVEFPEGEQVGIPRRSRFTRVAHSAVADADGGNPSAEREQRSGEQRQQPEDRGTGGWWAGAEWLPCIDGKSRPVEPGTFPLAHGAPARVGRLRAYGNAIVAPVAAEFIQAYMEGA